MKQVKGMVRDGEQVAGVYFYNGYKRRCMSLESMDLFDKRDFERFEKWYQEAKAWVLEKNRKPV